MSRPPIIRAFLGDEVIADNFAGGGGASTGIALALGRSPDLAVNHDPEAIAMHRVNHPTTEHRIESVWAVDPRLACRGMPVALAWFSPDCKHHSKAKGGKPRDQKIRGLAWIAVTWAHRVRPRVIVLENVEEFRDWGPLHRIGPNAGRPIAAARPAGRRAAAVAERPARQERSMTRNDFLAAFRELAEQLGVELWRIVERQTAAAKAAALDVALGRLQEQIAGMPEPEAQRTETPSRRRAPRRCSGCDELGHDIRRCTRVTAGAAAATRVAADPAPIATKQHATAATTPDHAAAEEIDTDDKDREDDDPDPSEAPSPPPGRTDRFARIEASAARRRGAA